MVAADQNANRGQWARRALFAFIVIASLRVAWLGEFMLDVRAVDHAVQPHIRDLDDEDMREPFFPKHNCFTCYAVAAELAGRPDTNVYDGALYKKPDVPTKIHEEIGTALNIDRYQYPPPFLLLPSALVSVGGGFFGARALFFLLTLASFAGCLWAIRRQTKHEHSWLVWLAWPAVLATMATLTSLQIGNVHALVVIASIGAMSAFARGRDRLGGALLGFAVVSKIFPGLLLVYLLGLRRWRAIAWTCAAGIVYALVALLIFGPHSYESFVSYQLPRLASGEAFSFAWEYTRALTVNSSLTGAVYKLHRLGALDNPAPLVTVVSWLYAAGVIGLAGWAGHRDRGSRTAIAVQVSLWLALLLLAQLRSPFLPWGYGNFVSLWLVASLAFACRRTWQWIGLAVVWLVYSPALPLPFGPPTVAFDWVYTLLAFVFGTGLATWIVARRGAEEA